MPALGDLPDSAVRFITRFARTRLIPGTNRFARVCRGWRDAAIGSDDQEQLQLLLALEGLPPDSVTSTSQWLSQHGACVTSLRITHTPATTTLFQQLQLSTAPLAGLQRLEVDGADSLVALAPTLPQLVALTHLAASISLSRPQGSTQPMVQGVFSACGVPLLAVPCLQQLFPGLKSLLLDVNHVETQADDGGQQRVDVPVAELLPHGLEQLHTCRRNINVDGVTRSIRLPCATLTSFTALRSLSVDTLWPVQPDLLLQMPGLERVAFGQCFSWVDARPCVLQRWSTTGLCAAPQHLTKLIGMSMVRIVRDDIPLDLFHWPTVAELPPLRQLEVYLLEPGEASWVQQLSGLVGLQHLSLHLWDGAADEAADVLTALSGIQQLTCLTLDVKATVARPTWAALLPHLTQLRVLVVGRQQLLEGHLAAELHKLTELQCLYVVCYPDDTGNPAATGAQVGQHMQVLNRCSCAVLLVCHGWNPCSTAYLGACA